MLLTLKGVRNANKESDIYGEDGTCSLALKAAAKPVVLNSSVNTPGNGMDIFILILCLGTRMLYS